MANKVIQYRYYNDGNLNNFPSKATGNLFTSGTAFSETIPILQLGIQSLPGTKFKLNNSVDPIIIGSTGIYELNLDNKTEISSLAFDATSIQNINENNGAYLIVDIIYENSEGCSNEFRILWKYNKSIKKHNLIFDKIFSK